MFLRNKILVKNEDQYTVNFSPEFKLMIAEAKHLDKMGYPLPKTILNIAL